jgi:hypothetical protein
VNAIMAPFYEPLSARDAWFLYAERAQTPLDIGTVYVFEGGSRVPGGRGALGVEETIKERITPYGSTIHTSTWAPTSAARCSHHRETAPH